jgi:hypothetical protein
VQPRAAAGVDRDLVAVPAGDRLPRHVHNRQPGAAP